MSNRQFYLRCAGVLLVAFLLRWFGLTDQCLTNDEVIEVEDAVLSTWSEIHWCPDDFPPLYRVLMAVWESAIGGETTTRWMSLILGMLFVPGLMATTNQITKSRSATLWTGFVAAVNPLMIHYSQESRAYMLFLCLAAWNLFFFARCLESNRRSDWIGFALLAAAGCYAHYYFGLWLIGLGLVWIITFLRKRRSLANGMMAIGIMIVTMIPLFSFFVPDFQDTVGYPVKAPFNLLAAGYTYYAFVAGFCIGPSRAELHELGAERTLIQFLPWLAVVGVLVCVLGYQASKWLRSRMEWLPTLFVCAVFPFAVAATLSSLTDLRFGVRYVVICVVPILCTFGIGMAQITNQKLRFGLAATFAMLAIFATYTRHFVPRYKNEDLRSVAQKIGENESGTVFILADYNKRPLGHYVGNEQGFVPLPDPKHTSNQIDDDAELAAVTQMVTQADSTRPIWIVLCRAYHGDPHLLFRNWLSSNSQIELVAEFDGAKLLRYQPSVQQDSSGS